MATTVESETFGSLWDRLESELRARFDVSGLYGAQLIARACKEPSLAAYEHDLTNLVRLRNLIKHNEHVPLAQATAAANEIVRAVIALLNRTALEIAARPVYTVTEDSQVEDVTSTMESEVYTAVPVVRDGHIIGVFSEATAVRLLVRGCREGGAVLARRVGDLVEFLDQPNQSDRFAHYMCTTGGTPATDVFEWFGESTTTGIRLSAVFVTETGTAESLPIGVITAWDLRNVHARITA